MDYSRGPRFKSGQRHKIVSPMSDCMRAGWVFLVSLLHSSSLRPVHRTGGLSTYTPHLIPSVYVACYLLSQTAFRLRKILTASSGLDNVAASNLIRLLSELSKGGRTIVCTIHQPAASLFALFDLAYFVGGGRCVYQGGVGPHLLTYLTELKLACPEYYNPADFGEFNPISEDKTTIATEKR